MTHDVALSNAIDLAKIALETSPIDLRKEGAGNLADFIASLTQRLEKM